MAGHTTCVGFADGSVGFELTQDGITAEHAKAWPHKFTLRYEVTLTEDGFGTSLVRALPYPPTTTTHHTHAPLVDATSQQSRHLDLPCAPHGHAKPTTAACGNAVAVRAGLTGQLRDGPHPRGRRFARL